jgi:hypothetical protein
MNNVLSVHDGLREFSGRSARKGHLFVHLTSAALFAALEGTSIDYFSTEVYRHRQFETGGLGAADTFFPMSKHASDAGVQIAAEATILAALSKAIGIPFTQGLTLSVGDARVRPDGVATDESVFVEVFAHIGKLKGGQRHKVSTDALKLLAIRESRPNARLILAFADEAAAASVSGWRAATLKANGIEIRVVSLPAEDRAKIEAAQVRQKMVNLPAESVEPEGER